MPRRAAGWGLLACVVAASAAAADAAPARRALLIGINEYAKPSIPDLRGAVNDVRLMRRILVTRFGFEEAQIRTLLDRDATRAGMLREIDRLIATTQPDDFVYFHYSGHGSQVTDRDGDEPDGLDETLVPHDGRQGGVPDIIDDELAARFARLRARGALLVFDSCHSGTITRVVTPVQPRFVPPEAADATPAPRSRSASAAPAAAPIEAANHVVLSGAPADKEALDGPLDGGFYGLFSYSLAQALDAEGVAATPRALIARTRQELNRIQRQLNTRPPEPQIDAAESSLGRPIFLAGSDGPPPVRRAWLEVEPIDERLLRLRAGLDLNARPGSQWGIYPPGDERFAYGGALATGIVSRIEGRDAILELPRSRRDIPPQARAIALMRAPATDAVTLRFVTPRAGDPVPAAVTRIATALRQRAPSVRIVGIDAFAWFIVEVDGARWTVLDAGGLKPLVRFEGLPDAEIVDALVRVTASAQQGSALQALSNPASDIRIRASLVDEYPATSAGRRDLAGLPQLRIRRPGMPRSPGNSLMLEIETNVDAYLTIAGVDTEGRVNLLFPNAAQRPDFLPDGFHAAGRVLRIPDSLEDANRSGFHWDCAPPVGQDTISVFAATDLSTARLIREVLRESAGDANRLRALPTALTASAAAPADDSTATRSLAARGEWTSASLVLQVNP